MAELATLQSALPGYRLERELGRGGMATVYLARDLKHDRPVALKVLHPELAAALGPERFVREIEISARLQHPHILGLIDSGTLSDAAGRTRPYYVMPLVEGESLRDRLRRERQLPLGDALRIGREVADALSYAHAHGVVHRDIKPENILLSGYPPSEPDAAGGWHALVADFGIARAIGTAGADRLTATGLALGTPAYMSPEQATGDVGVDGRSDIYALGCVVYELLAGEPPHAGPTAQAILARRFTEPVRPLSRVRPGVPPAAEAAVSRALAKVPGDRFATAAEFGAALEQLPAARLGPARRIASRGTALSVAALLAVGMVVYTISRPHSDAPAAATTAPVQLAVLPFRTLGLAGDPAALGIGIPDAIISRLAGVGRLRLRPTSSVLRYAGTDLELAEVGRALAVEYLLTGTVQSAGDRLRVSVQLVRPADAAPVWGQHYDLARQDLLTLQDSISERVSAALALRLTAAEQERLFHRYTANVRAYELYLRGRSLLARVIEDSTRAAVAAFEYALALDSSYAPARAGLAMASADMHLRFATGNEVKRWGERAEREAARALALDSGLAEAHLARAAVYRKAEFNWDLTLEESARALALNPSLDLAHYFRAGAFYHLGLFRQAEREVRQALAVNPENRVEQLRTRGVIAFLTGHYPEAVSLLEDVRKGGSKGYADSYLALAYFFGGDTARALAIADSLSRSPSTPASTRARAFLASFTAARDPLRAKVLLRGLEGGRYMDHHVAFSMGEAYAQLGRLPQALTWLRRAVDTGFPCYPWFARDPLLTDPLGRDPEFRRFMADLRQRWEAAGVRYPD